MSDIVNPDLNLPSLSQLDLVISDLDLLIDSQSFIYSIITEVYWIFRNMQSQGMATLSLSQAPPFYASSLLALMFIYASGIYLMMDGMAEIAITGEPYTPIHESVSWGWIKSMWLNVMSLSIGFVGESLQDGLLKNTLWFVGLELGIVGFIVNSVSFNNYKSVTPQQFKDWAMILIGFLGNIIEIGSTLYWIPDDLLL